MTRVAIDLLGGDAGPGVVADALAQFLRQPASPDVDRSSPVSLCVVGPRNLTEELLAERGVDIHGEHAADIAHANDCVPMTSSSQETLALVRERDDLTSTVGIDALRDGRADAFVSIGHTGATVAASVFGLGRLPGMGRPGLAVELPSGRGPLVFVDCGAAPFATEHDLIRFACAGTVYARSLGIAAPRVGLLTIGSERGKGDRLRKNADALLESAFVADYIGAVEGHDLVGDCAADVVVVDGFTGNVALKSMEGALRWSVSTMARAYGNDGPARELLRTSHFLSGGVLLGVPGAVVVGHGASSPIEIIACINRAAALHAGGVVDEVRRSLDAFGQLDARGEPLDAA